MQVPVKCSNNRFSHFPWRHRGHGFLKKTFILYITECNVCEGKKSSTRLFEMTSCAVTGYHCDPRQRDAPSNYTVITPDMQVLQVEAGTSFTVNVYVLRSNQLWCWCCEQKQKLNEHFDAHVSKMCWFQLLKIFADLLILASQLSVGSGAFDPNNKHFDTKSSYFRAIGYLKQMITSGTESRNSTRSNPAGMPFKGIIHGSSSTIPVFARKAAA